MFPQTPGPIDPAALLYTGTNAVDATPFVRTKLGL